MKPCRRKARGFTVTKLHRIRDCTICTMTRALNGEGDTMTTITAADVKKLRDMTGAGMMDCKNALTETNGDIEAAVDLAAQEGPVEGRQEVGPHRRRRPDRHRRRGQDRRRRRSQLGNRLRRPQRPVPGHGARHRLAGPGRQGRPRQAARRDLSRHEEHRRDAGQGNGRHHRREHERAPHGRRHRQGRRRRRLRALAVADGLGKIGVLVASGKRGRQADAVRARPQDRHAHRRRQPDDARRQRERAVQGR